MTKKRQWRGRAARILLAGAAAILLLWLRPAAAQVPGDVLPSWSPGTLDIHQINTGKGNAAFLVFPDGTTMLLDTGTGTRNPPRGTLPRPDRTRTPGEWVARYVARMAPPGRSPVLDYTYLSHFHADHMGDLSADAKPSKSGAYKLTGIIEVAESIPVRKMFDRGWPDYSYPLRLKLPMMDNYRGFLKWQMEHRGMAVERLRPGRNDQIVLMHDPKRYPDFEVRNIAANGEVWRGVGTATRQTFPPLQELAAADYPSENECSLAIRISYGRFDYFNGGDIEGTLQPGVPTWHDVETPVARAVGPVEACVLNHHGNRNSMNACFLAALQPRVYIIPVWSSDHPGHDVIDRMYSTRLYPGPRDVFATNMVQANKDVIGTLLDRLKSDQGHILLRVEPGGSRFRVIILDDSTEGYRVKSVHGPYECR